MMELEAPIVEMEVFKGLEWSIGGDVIKKDRNIG